MHKERWVQPHEMADAMTKAALKTGPSKLKVPCDLFWSQLGCSVLDTATHRSKTVLHGNFGAVVPGEMCALVGPSGAGIVFACMKTVWAIAAGPSACPGHLLAHGPITGQIGVKPLVLPAMLPNATAIRPVSPLECLKQQSS